MMGILERSGGEEPAIFIQEYNRKAAPKPVEFPDAGELGEPDDAFVDAESDGPTEVDAQEASSSTARPKSKAKKDGGTGSGAGGSRKAAQAQALDRLAKIVIGKAKR